MTEHVTRPLPAADFGFSLNSIPLPAVGKLDDETHSCLHWTVFDLLLHLDFRGVPTDLDSRSDQWITLADYFLLLLVVTQDHLLSCLIRFMWLPMKRRGRAGRVPRPHSPLFSSIKVHDGTMKTGRACPLKTAQL